MWHDLRQAARVLGHQRTFLCLTSLVLAAGIGLNVAIFSVVDALMFRPLPVESSDRLVSVYQVLALQPDRPAVLDKPQYEFLARYNEAFTDVTGRDELTYTLHADGEADLVNAELVFSNYFPVLGVQTALGRTLLAGEDDLANPERAVVISHALWTRRFRSDPTIVGKQIRLTSTSRFDVAASIVGVMGPVFKGVAAPWRPTQLWISVAQGHERAERGFAVTAIGRLKPGVSFEQARAVVAAQAQQLYSSRPVAPAGYKPPRLVAYRTNSVRVPSDPAAAVVPARLAAALTLAVAIVLLVATANVAGLLLARGVARSNELAIRRVLGAAPWRIARQLLAETMLLAVMGSGLGAVFAAWLLGGFSALTPPRFALDVTMDSRILLFTTALCVLTGVLIAIMPVRQSMRVDVFPPFASGSAMQTPSFGARLRHVVTVPQVALSLMLMVTASLLVQDLLTLELADLGYESRDLLVATSYLRMEADGSPVQAKPAAEQAEREAERRRRLYDYVLPRLRALGATQPVAMADALPIREPPGQPNWSVVSQEAFATGARARPPAERAAVSQDYFRTMGISLIAGRDFDERDTRHSQKVAVVSTALARQLWPNGDAVGRTLTIVNEWAPDKPPDWHNVVGVVNDVKPVLHERGGRPFVYFALSQQWSPSASYVLLRGSRDVHTLSTALKDAITTSDARAEVRRVRTMRQMVSEILYPRRVAAAVLATSALLALVLALVGVYSVMSYSVAQRTTEIGIRMALGARAGDVVHLVLREGAIVAGVSSLAGGLLSYLAIRLISARYLALPQVDVATFLIAPVLLTAIVLLACYIPARRASCVAPLEVLRRT